MCHCLSQDKFADEACQSTSSPACRSCWSVAVLLLDLITKAAARNLFCGCFPPILPSLSFFLPLPFFPFPLFHPPQSGPSDPAKGFGELPSAGGTTRGSATNAFLAYLEPERTCLVAANVVAVFVKRNLQCV